MLGLATWLATTCVFTPREYLGPVLALEALALTAAYYPLRLAEVALFGQLHLMLAQTFWLIDSIDNHASRPWWNPALIIVITLALARWWQRQKSLAVKATDSLTLQGVYALAVVGLVYFWLEPHFDAAGWLAFTSLLAILLTAYGALNRYWLLAAAGQIFLIVSGCQFCLQLSDADPAWWLSLAPIASLLLLSYSAIKWFERRPEARAEIKEPILQIGRAYRAIALIMSLWWAYKYIPAQENCWALVALGLLLFLLAGWRRNQETLVFGAIYTAVGIIDFWLPRAAAQVVYLPNLLAILALLAQQRIAKRLPERFRLPDKAHGGVIIAGGLSLWLFVSRWISQTWDGSYLTAGWSSLALILFIFGMAMRERVYRWVGLAVLAVALGRVVFVDVWRLEIIYRVLSFMALGIVLLVLGFLYNKYQEKIREWL